MPSFVNPDTIPRYREPAFNEPCLMGDYEDEILTCADCNWYIRCGKGDARTIVSKVSRYTSLCRDESAKRALANAVQLCGICAKRTELRACTDQICDEGYDERE